MTSYVAKYVSKKILGESLQNKFGTEDPYFEQVPATRLSGKPSKKMKKRKKALPPGLSDNDGKVLTKVKRRAYRLDMGLFSFLGMRFGWSSVIALIPVVGDGFDAFMALMVMKSCGQIDGGLPTMLKIRMMINIIIDFVIGLVPFVGDLCDVVFRANTRNVVLLEAHLRDQGKKNLRKSGLPMPEVDPSSPVEYDRMMRENPPDYSSRPPSRQPSRQPSRHPSPAGARQHDEHPPVPQPPQEARTGNARGGWLGRGQSRPHDVEMGHGSSR